MKIEIKPYDDSFVAVSFPEGFNTDLLNSVRKIPKRIWNNDEIPDEEQTPLLPEDSTRRMLEILKAKNYSQKTCEVYKKWAESRKKGSS